MTCAPQELACRLDRIAAALQAGPDWWAVAAVIVAAVGVIASTAVAIAAWTSSRRAVDIAARADVREAIRDEERARERVDQWLAEFIVAGDEYLTKYAEWMNLRPHEQPTERTPMQEPATSRMRSAFEGARLVARGEDAETLSIVADYVGQLHVMGELFRLQAIVQLSDRLRDWRNGSTDRSALIDWVRGRPFLRA